MNFQLKLINRVASQLFIVAEPKITAANSIINIVQDKRCNHQLEAKSNILKEKSIA